MKKKKFYTIKSRLKNKTANYIINNITIWLQGQDLLKTLQLVLGYEVVAGAGFVLDSTITKLV